MFRCLRHCCCLLLSLCCFSFISVAYFCTLLLRTKVCLIRLPLFIKWLPVHKLCGYSSSWYWKLVFLLLVFQVFSHFNNMLQDIEIQPDMFFFSCTLLMSWKIVRFVCSYIYIIVMPYFSSSYLSLNISFTYICGSLNVWTPPS